MKTQFLPLFALIAFVPSCTIYVPKPTFLRSESDKVLNRIPEVSGIARTGTYKLYHYTVYDFTVMIIPESHLVEIEQAYIEDFDKDGNFDSVWILYQGEWQFRTNLNHISLPNSLDESIFKECLTVATYARQNERGK